MFEPQQHFLTQHPNWCVFFRRTGFDPERETRTKKIGIPSRSPKNMQGTKREIHNILHIYIHAYQRTAVNQEITFDVNAYLAVCNQTLRSRSVKTDFHIHCYELEMVTRPAQTQEHFPPYLTQSTLWRKSNFRSCIKIRYGNRCCVAGKFRYNDHRQGKCWLYFKRMRI